MKRIRYKIVGFAYEYDPATKKEVQKELLSSVDIPYTKENEERAKMEAYNGEYTIEDDGQPDPTPTPPSDDSAVWDELDTAYQAGYDEGYTEGVNSAYDQ